MRCPRRDASTALAFLLLLAAAVPACSGTPASDLFGRGTSDGGASLHPDAAGGGDAATNAGDDAGGPAPDASAGADSPAGLPPATDASAGTPESGIDDAGSSVEGGADSPSGGDDSGGAAGSIPCGNSTCTAPAEFCCVTFGQGGQMQACAMDRASCMGQGDTPVSCASSTQCPAGQVCCGSNANSFYSDVSCQPAPCGGTTGGVEQVQFCDPQAPGDCPPSARRCQQSMILGGFFVCQ